jgi:peptidoglycan/LPS O-acetylase OafA/YrhL
MTDPYTPPPGYGQNPPPGYGQAPPYGYPYPQQNSQEAVIALVAALLSFVICPVIPAIVALVYAGRASRTIAASGGALGGQSMVTAAKIIAWVHLVLVVVGVLVFLAVVVSLTGSS